MKICLLSTDRLLFSDKEFENALTCLHFGVSDKKGILKLKKRSVAAESLGSRMALIRLCGDEDFGNIERTENGKPYFSKSDAPFFSLSHTKGIAAAALCDRSDGLVGIDIEVINTDRNLSNIAKRFFDTDELDRYQKCGSPESFYSIWTEKEARVKLFGQNLSDELSKEKSKKESLYFYKYMVNISGTQAILCIASEQEQKEIIFINSEDFEIYGLQNRA